MDKHYRDLLIRALKGTLDTASRREFDRWVSDADNRRIYENALRIWDDVQRRTSAYNPDRDRLWEQLQSRIEVCGTPQRAERPAPKRRWMPILRTAAAVAAGVVVTLFAVRPDLSRTPVPARQEFCAFGGKSLGEICRYLSRWYDIRIDISPALAHNYAYTFTLTDEPLEAILRIMSRINPIVYTFSDNRSVSISEIE